MELTGKCKVDFELWIYNNMVYCNVNDVYNWFLEVPQSMKYGVYLEFFDLYNYDIEVIRSGKVTVIFTPYVNDLSSYSQYTKSEARTEAIKKANEIYNK